MIQANELRIGNLVRLYGKPYKVTPRAIYDMHHEGASPVYGITITEEILLKCGFVFNDDKYEMKIMKSKLFLRKCYLGGFYWGINSSDCSFCEFDDVKQIEHVHSLQNFMHALTGQELNIEI